MLFRSTNEDGKVFLTPFPVKMFGGKKAVEIDVAFPVVHGTNVEDGAFQGYLKTMGIPFVGCDVTASAIGMDKYIMKAVLKECDVPVLDAQLYTLQIMRRWRLCSTKWKKDWDIR